jgi:hypothetical protein
LCLLAAVSWSVAIAQQWVNIWSTGNNGHREGHGITVDSSGGVYAVGRAGEPFAHFAVIKYDGVGGREWVCEFQPANTFPTSGGIRVTGAGVVAAGAGAVTMNAALWVLGCSGSGDSLWMHVHGTERFGSSLPSDMTADSDGNVCAVGPTHTDSTDFDILTVKYKTNGGLEWARRYDGPRHREDKAHGVVVDAAGNVYVAGETWNLLNKQKPVILKYSSAGDLLWVRMLGPEGETRGRYHDIELGQDGYLYAAGRGWSDAPAPVAKYSTTGDSVWARLDSGMVIGLAATSAGDLYSVGHWGGSLCVRRYSPDGGIRWARRYGRIDVTEAAACVLDHNEDLIVTGVEASLSTGIDIVTWKISPSGETLWTAGYDVGREDFAVDVAVDGDNSVYVTGHVRDTLHYYHDWITIKYLSNGPGIAEGTTRFDQRSGVSVAPSVARSTCLLSGKTSSARHRFLISDVNGRVVRRLSASQPHGVSIQAGWNLDDDSGHLVPNGVYFVTLDAPGQSACAKIIVQR